MIVENLVGTPFIHSLTISTVWSLILLRVILDAFQMQQKQSQRDESLKKLESRHKKVTEVSPSKYSDLLSDFQHFLSAQCIMLVCLHFIFSKFSSLEISLRIVLQGLTCLSPNLNYGSKGRTRYSRSIGLSWKKWPACKWHPKMHIICMHDMCNTKAFKVPVTRSWINYIRRSWLTNNVFYLTMTTLYVHVINFVLSYLAKH